MRTRFLSLWLYLLRCMDTDHLSFQLNGREAAITPQRPKKVNYQFLCLSTDRISWLLFLHCSLPLGKPEWQLCKKGHEEIQNIAVASLCTPKRLKSYSFIQRSSSMRKMWFFFRNCLASTSCTKQSLNADALHAGNRTQRGGGSKVV